jgi:hypothetical protein
MNYIFILKHFIWKYDVQVKRKSEDNIAVYLGRHFDDAYWIQTVNKLSHVVKGSVTQNDDWGDYVTVTIINVTMIVMTTVVKMMTMIVITMMATKLMTVTSMTKILAAN